MYLRGIKRYTASASKRGSRGIEGMAEVSWARVEERRATYEAWSDARLTLDTSSQPPERLLAKAIDYVHGITGRWKRFHLCETIARAARGRANRIPSPLMGSSDALLGTLR